MSETTYYQRKREVILNRAKDYYETNKDLLRERAKNKHIELSEEEKNIKREYGKKKIPFYLFLLHIYTLPIMFVDSTESNINGRL